MKAMKNVLCLFLAVLVLVPGLSAYWDYDLNGAQYWVPEGPPQAWNEVSTWVGWPYKKPCFYDYFGQNSGGSLGCSCDGLCPNSPYWGSTNQYIDTSFYQWWNCSSGWVEGTGYSLVDTFYDPRYYNDQPYPAGLQSGATAYVHLSGMPTQTFRSLDEKDCDGTTDYYGGWSYGC